MARAGSLICVYDSGYFVTLHGNKYNINYLLVARTAITDTALVGEGKDKVLPPCAWGDPCTRFEKASNLVTLPALAALQCEYNVRMGTL